jgi:hypothetical protein
MKLLILAIYSDSKEYQEMLKIQRSYFHKFKNVTSFFIDFCKDQKEDIVIKDDFIYVKGEDTFLNITYKTIKALEYALKHIQFDYVIRTNMSTIIDIPKLNDFCLKLPKTNVYTSGFMLNLQWLDIKSGIKDNSLFGTLFASGTSIIMSNDVVRCMIDQQSKIRYDIVDDVAIGVFISKYLPSAYYPQSASFCFVPKNIKPYQVSNKYIFYRNRAYKDRKKDIKNMKTIRNVLMNKIKTRKNKL